MKHPRLILMLVLSLLGGWPAQAETENSQEIADRFELLLVRSPQAGSAFDRVVEWYSTQGGGLEVLQKKWSDAAGDPATKRSYLILQGLLAERLRSPDKARDFYLQALAEAGEAAQAARLLAALETTEGNFPAAAEAYQKALASETLAAVDRIELMRSLALLYQRAFEDDKALGVWRDAIAKFPDDPYVLEEAGEAFLAAGNYDDARKTFTRLRDLSGKDPFRKIAASLRLARTDELEGKTDAAVRTYELALEDTSEGSWINREVRGRIEELFRRKDDLPGLLAYYEKRTTAVPQDYMSLAAQANVLEQLGRSDEAIERLRAATRLAPDNLDLRLTFIRRLSQAGKADEAVTEIAEIIKPADTAPEALLLAGNLYWSRWEESKDEKFRNLALETWQRIAPADSTEVGRIAQLAEILAAHDQADAALAQWQRLVALAPGASDARQRIAEVYLKRNDKPAAVAVLAEIVAGDRAQPENFLSLARIQDRLEWKDEARVTMQKAVELFPTNYEILSLALTQTIDAGDATTAAALFPKVWENAPNEFFAEDVIKKYAVFLDRDGKGKDAAQALAANLATPLDAEVLFRLAISQQEQPLSEKALAYLREKAKPIRAARAASEFALTFGTPEQQITALQSVAQVEPRMAGESLRAVARIQAENNQAEDALKTISQLIERTPADASLYTLYADTASRGGKFDLAVARLREALRYVEDATTLRLQLATFLQMQGQQTEAAKVLQEAFEKEDGETRRMEIFRRQIEAAMASGSLDALTASLREKQSKEQGGARYGAYLAEILMLQNDFLGAREELARSLGRNPDNVAAVSRLLDLADRGGDEEEGLRLSKRLAELEPSTANRSSYLARLFNANQPDEAIAEFARARADILKDPAGWNSVLQAMRKAGFETESDQLVAEIATAQGTGAAAQIEIARLRLMQRDYAAAEAVLWQIVEDPSFGSDLEVLMSRPPAIPAGMNYPAFWLIMQPLNQLANDVRNNLQRLFQPGSRGRSIRSYGSMYSGMGGLPSTALTPDQKARGEAFLLLSQLAQAQGAQEEFFKKADAAFVRNQTSRRVQLALFSLSGYQEGINKLVLLQAEDGAGGIETDRIVTTIGASNQELSAALDKVKARMEKADAPFAFDQALAKLTQEVGSMAAGADPKTLADYQERVRKLLDHPGFVSRPNSRLSIAGLAAQTKQFDLALKLLDEAEAAGAAKAPASPFIASAYPGTLALIFRQAIATNDPRAEALFEKVLSQDVKAAGLARAGITTFRGYGGQSMLAQQGGELVLGDPEFSINQFRILYQPVAPQTKPDVLQEWFAKRTTPGKLDRFALGVFYFLWSSGKKDEALKYLEAIYQKDPSPRVASLLFEAYERADQPAKALGVIDQAAMQDGETAAVRKLRRLRLLRLAGKIDEARALATESSKGRVPMDVRNLLLNEMQLLQMPADNLRAMSMSYPSRGRGTTDRGQQLREQVNKLVQEKKTDDAERIAVQILQRSLPAPDDYQEASLRYNMVSALESMKRIDAYRASLRERLQKDPADAEAAIRLAEASTNGNDASLSDMVKTVSAHPDRTSHLDYALQILQRRSDSRDEATELIAGILRTNPRYLGASGVQLGDRLSGISDAQSGALLADAVANLSEADYNAVFLPVRLTGYSSEMPLVASLAEFSSQAGKPAQAIALLQRVADQASVQMDVGITVILRLAELQLAQGDAAGAAATMKILAEGSKARPNFGMGRSTLGMAIMNIISNSRMGNQDTDLVQRLAKIAEQTGTLDLILQTMDSEFGTRASGAPAASMGVSPALVVRTYLGRPEAAKEWRKIAQSDATIGGYFNLPMLGNVIRLLAGQSDASSLVPALIRKVPDQQFLNGGDYTLSYLIDILPFIAKYPDNSDLQKHVDYVLSRTMQGPNSQYLASFQMYPGALNALLDYGYTAQARKLFDATASERSSRGRSNQFAPIEARLDLAEGRSADVRVVCAGIPAAAGKLKVFWKMGIDTDNESGIRGGGAVWSESNIALPKKSRPVELEILAGPNPVLLEKIATISKPEPSGSIEGKLPAPLGILQARWKLSDGTVQSGPLTAYVSGDNSILKGGIPVEGAVPEGFKPGQPGPLGPTSAIAFKTTSMRSDFVVPIGSINLEGTGPEIVALAGWVKSNGYGNTPQVEIRTTLDGGEVSRDGVYAGGSGPNQWRQVFRLWTREFSRNNSNRLADNSRSMDVSLRLQVSGGYNMQMQIEGVWDGFQFVRIKQADESGQLNDLLKTARAAVQKGNSTPAAFSEAADAYLKAIRLDPAAVFNQGSSVVDAFQKSNRMGDLFSLLSSPALYLPNPLQNNSVTLRNDSLIAGLVTAATQPDAPASAAAWLRSVENAPLDENLRFLIDAALFREKVARDPSFATAQEILALLGFKPDAFNRDRIRSLWNWSSSNIPTRSLLELAESKSLSQEMIDLLKGMSPPIEVLASKQLITLWLLAPTDPAAALDQWKQVDALRKSGQSGANVDSEASNAVFARFAKFYPSPGDLVAVARTWFSDRNSSRNEYAQRQLVEFLYAASKADGPRSADYTSLWADEEISALQNSNYSAQRERIRELAQRLLAEQNWARLDSLLALSAKNSSLRSSSFQREFNQLRDLAALAQGQFDKAWPVAWCEPGTNAQKVSVHWRWNVRDAVADEGRFDATIAVADKPLTPRINGQKSVEIQFGSIPAEVKTFATVEGDKSEGAHEVSLPEPNGFLRVVSVFENSRVPGPLLPVISGRRVYPAEGSDLKSMLGTGERPLPENQLFPGGNAPDGSPAIRIGGSGNRSLLSYTGPFFPVQPGRFYVGRIWIRRAGNGTASAASMYQAVSGTPRRDLNMVLSERQEATGQWMLFTRAIPSFPQHTFWIPYQKVESMSPRLWEIDPGTEVAAFELYDVEGWKYGQWLNDLAMTREKAGETPDAAAVAAALKLAAVEPLTALDYHGDWLAEQAILQGQAPALLDLYRAALQAEANPLFARPKLYRIFSSLMKVADATQLPPDLRLAAVRLAMDNAARARAPQRFIFQRKLLDVTPGPETVTAIRQDLLAKLQDPDKGGEYLATTLSSRSYLDDRPVNEFLNLAVAMKDPEIVNPTVELIKKNDDLDEYEKTFATLAFQSAIAPPAADAKDKIAAGFVATRSESSPESFMFWPSLLGELLATQGKSPELLMALRRAGYDRLKDKSRSGNYNEKIEYLRAAAYLLETAIAQGDQATIKEITDGLVAALPAGANRLTEPTLRLVLRNVVLLTDSGNKPAADQIVRALEKDIRASSKMTEAFSKYVPAPNP